ncbi:Ribokinase-like protein [Kickxella alabastrina]|uniref:Ribokinase-like protein n=1 Tax=Kickxella alabastrina TaxID=61397 RepID=UPI00221EE038|nr:Ribokinase-like protein [Kickxella alabastrina]KAI7833666.1 Ribokinase-like protein [Kickxella alabastrina]
MSQDLNGALVGFCNPLLDISAVQYNLKANDAILASAEHVPLFQTLIDSYDAKFLPGGAGQNTLRGRLQGAASKAGLRTNYMVNSEKPTGTCALLITGANRSMVANLSAAETFQFAHTQSLRTGRSLRRPAVAKHALENNKTFTMNISAPFVPTFYKGLVEKTLPYIDILFGNETEAASLSEAFGLGTTDIKAIAKKIADQPKEGSKPRLVVFTQGSEHTIVASSDSDEVRVYDVTPVAKEEIGDSNGTALDACVEAGHWLGGEVVRQIGPNYPTGELKFVASGDFTAAIEKI